MTMTNTAFSYLAQNHRGVESFLRNKSNRSSHKGLFNEEKTSYHFGFLRVSGFSYWQCGSSRRPVIVSRSDN